MATTEAEAAPAAFAYTTGETLLAINHVNLTLDGKLILRDVCVDIKDIDRADCVTGQVICFLGPSGIGKTRLSRIIAGLDPPTSGSVTVSEVRPEVPGYPAGVTYQVPVRKGMVGMVPQNYPLFEFLTVKANLLLAASRSPQPKKAVENLLAFTAELGLAPHMDKYPAQLSGGTRQRVAIVRQLLCASHFLVMDEPFSGLDPIMKQKTCELITQVANRDTLNTVIIVTHDITEGMAVADHVWIMGQEQDAQGTWLPGARIVEQVDFAAMGICWRPDIYSNADFLDEVAKVKARFQTLVPR